MQVRRRRPILFAALLLALSLVIPGCRGRQRAADAEGNSPTGHHRVFFRIQAGPSITAPLNGRLLIFLKRGADDSSVDGSGFKPEDNWVTSKEIHNLVPGASVEVDADDVAFPKPFSALPAATYEAQAVLDVNHSYNYGGRDPEDWVSDVAALPNWSPVSGPEPLLILDSHPGMDLKRAGGRLVLNAQAKLAGAHEEDLVSPLLSHFWGHPVSIKAWVILPPGYDQHRDATWPTVYWTHGFGGTLFSALHNGVAIHDRMKQGKLPPMIWVMLDQSIPQGTHEFADSVNNGPWGTALTTEFIPYLEAKYRMDARPAGRLLNGHSSGGWATLQLQVNYPKVFGGTWSTSPDSSDFHDFTGPDLYAPNANMYRKPDGTAVPIIREDGKVVATMEQLGHLESVTGPYGGQLGSFDWVFSPRGLDGAPTPMFDRQTGVVDPVVVAYWRDHYDLAHLVEANWQQRGTDLKGRIHIWVGTADTFYLDGAAHRLDAVLAKLGADAHFTYLPGRTHMNVYQVGEDAGGLFDQIGTEMYSVARPGVDWKNK